MPTNSYIAKLKARLDQAIIQRDHWKQLAENRNSIVVTEVCPESRSVEEYIVDADSVRASWRLIRSYREQIEALRAALLGIASVNPAERGIEWAKSYASDGLKGAGSELYARWLDALKEAEELRAENARLTTQLAAIQGGMGEANKHGAQPEVAENTGSHAMATNQLQRQEQAVARDVDGVAAPCEASPGDDIFAWATFDGEGSYDLRLFDGNESYRDDFRRNNPKHHPDWVFPLYRNSITAAMAAEVERLREERDSFQRVGILATEERDALRAELAITRRVIDRIGQLCTTPHESKERFIRRVQSVIEWERAAQQDQPQ